MKRKVSVWLISLLCIFLMCACGANEGNTETESGTIETETGTGTENEIDTEGANTEDSNTEAPNTEDANTEESNTEAGTETDSEKEENVPETPIDPNMYSWASGYQVYDPLNTRGLSNEKKPHAYGVAANGQPASLSVQSQNFINSLSGTEALVVDLKSKEKVLYLTFSCGYEYNNNSMKILDILKEKNVPAAFFGELGYFKKNPNITKRLIEEGHILGNHTATHPDFPTLSRDEMASQIYKVDQFLRENYGYECKYFRFPGGYYSQNSLDLVGNIGHRAVFWSVAYRDWDRNDLQGVQYTFDTVTSRLHPGAVIVLHAVYNDNVDALARIIDYARAQGYTFKSLDDYPWED